MPRRTPPLSRAAAEAIAPPIVLAVATGLFCWKLLGGGLVVIGYDTMTYMYPYRYFAATALREGQIPLWNPYIFYGVPFLANLQSAVFYPLHAVFLLVPPTLAMNWSVVGHLYLASLTAYLAARQIVGLDRLSACVAGAIYSLGGFVGAQVGHLNQLNAAAWLPLALVALHRALTRHSRRWVALLAVILAVQLLAGHAQESYMTVAMLGAYAAFHCLRLASWAPLPPSRGEVASHLLRRGSALGREAVWAGLVLAAGGALAGGLAAMQLLPSNELTGLSIRSGGMPLGEAASFSLPPRELFVGLLPTFGLAGPSSNEYLSWVGVGGLMLALLGVLFRFDRAPTRFFAALGLVSFLLALGIHFPLFELAFRVPGMNLFRVPARWMLLASLALAMLAGGGLAFLRHIGRRRWPGSDRQDGQRDGQVVALAAAPGVAGVTYGPWRRLSAASRLLVAVALVAIAVAVLWPLQRIGGEQTVRLVGTWLALGTGAVVLAFWGLAAGPTPWPAVTAAVWVLVELFLGSRSLEYNNPNPEAVYTASRPVIDALRRDARPERILSIAATGYHPSDAADLVAPYAVVLGPDGALSTLINTKYKETLNPNLSMVLGLPTVDGYDGGILPLRRYVDYKGLLVPPEANLPDSLLRDQVKQIPPLGLLRLFGIKYIVDDAIGDVTHDGVFYDLASTITLEPGASVRLPYAGAGPGAEATGGTPSVRALGIVTSLDGASETPDDVPVGTVELGADSGAVSRVTLLAGRDTAEAGYTAAARHQQPTQLRPGGAQGSASAMYLAAHSLSDPQPTTWVTIRNVQPTARLRVHGLSLSTAWQVGPAPAAGQPSTLPVAGSRSWPVALGALGHVRLVHRSDVKLYRNESWLPRAYLTPGSRVVANAGEALAILGQEGHEPARTVLLERDPGPPAVTTSLRGKVRDLRDAAKDWLGILNDPHAGTVGPDVPLPIAQSGNGVTGTAPLGGTAARSGSGSAGVEWLDDAAERLRLRVEAPGPSMLVVRDTYYPGWEAFVDGRPVPLLRADTLFRAVPVPAGNHTVELRYRSRALERGLLLSAAALVATLGLALAPVPQRFDRWLRRRGDGAAHPEAGATW
jgi:hypothetical protein